MSIDDFWPEPSDFGDIQPECSLETIDQFICRIDQAGLYTCRRNGPGDPSELSFVTVFDKLLANQRQYKGRVIVRLQMIALVIQLVFVSWLVEEIK